MVTEALTRRKLIGGLGLLIAAPAVIRVAQLMPIKVWEPGPLYRGIKMQSWPFGEPEPKHHDPDYFVVEMSVIGGAKPLSYWTHENKTFEIMKGKAGKPFFWQPVLPFKSPP